jgi:hypothetical protein
MDTPYSGGPHEQSIHSTINIAYEFTLTTNIDTEPFGGQVAIARNGSYITKYMMAKMSPFLGAS